MVEEIKKQIKLKRAILNTLEKPIQGSAYKRNEQDIERKKVVLEKEIEGLKEQLKSMNLL